MTRKQSNAGVFCIIASVLLFSGTIFYMSANKVLQILSFPFALVMLAVFSRVGSLSEFNRIRDKLPVCFVYLLAVHAVINLVLISGARRFALYFGYEILLFVIAYLAMRSVDADRFEECCINFITAVAAVSVVLWLLPDLVVRIAPFSFSYENWYYKSLFIYNLNVYFPNRNCGPFWEPGLYQGFLNFALLLVAMRKNVKFAAVKCLILIFAVLTTFSSTGYFLMVLALLLFAFRIRNPFARTTVTLVLGMLGLTLLLNLEAVLTFVDRYTLFSITEKFKSGDNASVNTRIYSGLVDLRIALTRPFGADRSVLEELRRTLGTRYGNITASTNTLTMVLTYFGWVPGLLYAGMWIRGCLRQSGFFINRCVIVLFMLIILLTEPHADLMFFQAIFFAWNSRYGMHAARRDAPVEAEAEPEPLSTLRKEPTP